MLFEHEYSLSLISEDSEIWPFHLILKSIKMKQGEKEYQFAAEELDYPKYFVQIAIDPNADFNICLSIKGEDGETMFYCNK